LSAGRLIIILWKAHSLSVKGVVRTSMLAVLMYLLEVPRSDSGTRELRGPVFRPIIRAKITSVSENKIK
jgi:hypothetical protein